MNTSYLSSYRHTVFFIFLIFIVSCGENSNLSWTEIMQKGKNISTDLSISKQERLLKTEKTYLLALDKLEKTLAKEGVKTKEMRELFRVIEIVFRNQNKQKELIPILKRKVNIYIKYLGKNKILTASAHEELGYLYKKSENKSAAINEYKEALKIYQNKNRHSAVQRIKKHISTL